MTCKTENDLSIAERVNEIDSKLRKIRVLTWAAAELGMEKTSNLSDVEHMANVAALSELAAEIATETQELVWRLNCTIEDNAGAT